MKNNEVLVIQTKALMPPEQLNYIRKQILKQKEEGVIVLPSWFEPQVVSGDGYRTYITIIDEVSEYDKN